MTLPTESSSHVPVPYDDISSDPMAHVPKNELPIAPLFNASISVQSLVIPDPSSNAKSHHQGSTIFASNVELGCKNSHSMVTRAKARIVKPKVFHVSMDSQSVLSEQVL